LAISGQLSEAVHPSIWRGLVISFPAAIAKKLRAWKNKPWESERVDPKEILKHLGQVGKHWSYSKKIAERFGTEGVGPRGNKFGIMLRANIPKEGASSELGKLFWDEAEFDVPPGTKIQITGLGFYKPSAGSDVPWHSISGSVFSTLPPRKGEIIRWKA
jgi:hypothetical protein